MFYIGILPALFVLYIRSQTVRAGAMGGRLRKDQANVLLEFLKKILRPPLRARTWINVMLLFVALMGFWAGSQYLGASILTLSAQQGIAKPTALQLATLGLGVLSLFTIIGCLAVPCSPIAMGERNTLVATFILMIIGIAGGFGWAYYQNSMLRSSCSFPFLDWAVPTLRCSRSGCLSSFRPRSGLLRSLSARRCPGSRRLWGHS